MDRGRWVVVYGEEEKYISSSSQFPISPPVFQKGRYMATKSPHVLSLRAVLKASRPVEWVLMTLNFCVSSV